MSESLLRVIAGHKKAQVVTPSRLDSPTTAILNGLQQYIESHKGDILPFILGEIEKEVLENSEGAELDQEPWEDLVVKTLNEIIEDLDVGSI